MGEKRYIISEAAQKTGVEAHVLRYWEDELGLIIPRNEMGHRYYTEELIKIFKHVKELKDSGFQLKAVKNVLEEDGQSLDNMDNITSSSSATNPLNVANSLKAETPLNVASSLKAANTLNVTDELNEKSPSNSVSALNANSSTGISSATVIFRKGDKEAVEDLEIKRSEDKLSQFEQILGNIFTKSLSMNNQKLGDDIVARVTENVSTKVIKEMDYFMRVREEAEDERFKKLDETIRGIQKCNKEAAAHKEKKGKNRKRFFNK